MADLRDFTGKNRKFTGTASVKLPEGTTGQRVDLQGALRFNTTTGSAEYYTGTAWKAITEYDDNKVQSNIALLGFKTAVNGSLAKYNLQDQIIDEYEDASGIDAGNSTNENLITGAYDGAIYIPGTNYFGDDSDGALTTSGNVTHTVLSKNGSYDGDMLVKNYTDLTINAGHTLTVDQPCRGMLIFVSGDCVINGTLSMKEKGAKGNPASSGGSDSNAVQSAGIQLCFQTATGSTSFTNADTNFNGCGTTARTAIANFGNPSSNGDTVTVVRVGGAGGAGTQPGANVGGTITDGTGGGASGGGYAGGSGGGAGTAGTCFSGGSGGGGGNGGTGNAGTTFGGAGGSGSSGHNAWTGGGAGNPRNSGSYHGSYSGGTIVTGGGLGGLIYLIVKGDLTIGAAGKITAEGGQGTHMSNGSGASYGGDYSSAGGGGGGGRTIVAYGGTLSNSGSITAAGGTSPNISKPNGGAGGTGGAGVSTTIPVATDTVARNDLTLQSTANTASSAATKADLIMLMENAVGTATINVDIKGYVTADGGSNWTEGTLVDEGTWGTNKKIYAFHDATVTSGTDLRYKITTHNQSSDKRTKIHAVSIGWK
jgi:hypothetical protein